MSSVIGYSLADDGSYQSLHKPEKNRIVTHAFLFCSECNKTIYHCMGPNYSAICLDCLRVKKQGTQNV